MIVYRLLLACLSPIVGLVWALRRATGRAGPGELAQRLAHDLPTLPATRCLWLHGASNGELTSARRLIAAILDRRPDLGLVVTANTMTGCELVRGWRLPRTAVTLAPFDGRRALNRFLNHVRPAAYLMVENELWPNRLALLAGRGTPVLAVGARASERSAARWRLLPGLVRQVLQTIRFLSAQDEASAARFLAAGLPRAALGPVLDLKALAGGAEMAELPAELAGAFDRGATLLAASTHDGEEALVLAAFARQYPQGHWKRLILAPRHPRRAASVGRQIAAAGLAHRRRSAGQAPGDAPVYLADTLGEMDLWYRLAALTFVGGSLVARGGHTPHEPARYASAILHGPHVDNFAETYRALDAAGGAGVVADAETLGAALVDLGEAEARVAMTERARAVLDAPERVPLDRLLAALDDALGLQSRETRA